DWAYLHADHHLVAKTRFGRPIAHGGLTLTMAIGLLFAFESDRQPFGMDGMRFVRPAFLGDTIYAQMSPVEGHDLWILEVINQHEAVVLEARVGLRKRIHQVALGLRAAPQGAPGWWVTEAEAHGTDRGRFLDDLVVGQKFTVPNRRLVRQHDVEQFLD